MNKNIIQNLTKTRYKLIFMQFRQKAGADNKSYRKTSPSPSNEPWTDFLKPKLELFLKFLIS